MTVLVLPVNELPWPGYVILSHAQDHKYACHIGKTVPRDNHVKYWVLSGLFLKQQSCVYVYTKIHFVVVLLLLFFFLTLPVIFNLFYKLFYPSLGLLSLLV